MQELTCEQLYQEYQEIKILSDKAVLEWIRFHEVEGKKNAQKQVIKSLLTLVHDIKDRVRNLKDKISPAKLFFDFLDQQEIKSKIKEIFSENSPDEQKLFNLFRPISRKKITSKDYKKFVAMLTDVDNKEKLEKLMLETITENTTDSLEDFLKTINAIFLITFLKDETTITIDMLPTTLKDGFATNFERGNINVKEVGNDFGNEMEGGTIRVGVAGERFCYGMKGGTVYAKKVKGIVGSSIKGGTIYVEEADEIGYNLNRGTILSGKCEKIEQLASSQVVWQYEDSTKTYKNFLDPSAIKAPTILDFEELDYFKAQKEGIVIIEDTYLISYPDLTQGLEGGIMVLRKTPIVIGEGMSGGIIIIEDKDYHDTPEEIRKRISPTKTGGFIFLRVYPSGTSQGSKLVDVEDI